MPDPRRCRHLHPDARPCGSPAMRGQELCYQHGAASTRPARGPLPGSVTLPAPEDLAAVQRGLAELLQLVALQHIEDKRAKYLLAILVEAGANLARLDRQTTRARTLALRERALALAESRCTARHSQPADACQSAAPQPVAQTQPASSRDDRPVEDQDARQRRMEEQRAEQHRLILATREANRRCLSPALRLRYDAALAAKDAAEQAANHNPNPGGLPLSPLESEIDPETAKKTAFHNPATSNELTPLGVTSQPV